MYASNTMGRGIGIKKIELIVNTFPNIIYNSYVPTIEELINIKGIEKKIANLFISNLPKFFEFIKQNELYNLIYKDNIQNKNIKSLLFENKGIIITGFRNKEIENFIKLNGGIITNSINKKVILIIAKNKNKDTNKIIKARELKIDIINLNEFLTKYYLDIKN